MTSALFGGQISSFGTPVLGNSFSIVGVPYWLVLFSGGKAGVPTISTDEDYNILITALCCKPASTNVGISFNLDEISTFKIHVKRMSLWFTSLPIVSNIFK